MSTPSDTTKQDHKIPLTRGALYLLEFLFQDLSECNTPDKVVKYGRMWDKIRKFNNRKIEISWRGGADATVDFEKPTIAPGEDISELDIQKRNIERDEKQAIWSCENIVFEVNDKQRDLIRKRITDASEAKKILHRSSMGSNENHTLILLSGFGFGE